MRKHCPRNTSGFNEIIIWLWPFKVKLACNWSDETEDTSSREDLVNLLCDYLVAKANTYKERGGTLKLTCSLFFFLKKKHTRTHTEVKNYLGITSTWSQCTQSFTVHTLNAMKTITLVCYSWSQLRTLPNLLNVYCALVILHLILSEVKLMRQSLIRHTCTVLGCKSALSELQCHCQYELHSFKGAVLWGSCFL